MLRQASIDYEEIIGLGPCLEDIDFLKKQFSEEWNKVIGDSKLIHDLSAKTGIAPEVITANKNDLFRISVARSGFFELQNIIDLPGIQYTVDCMKTILTDPAYHDVRTELIKLALKVLLAMKAKNRPEMIGNIIELIKDIINR